MTAPAPLDRVEITEILIASARRGDHEAIGALGADAFRRIVAFYRYTGMSPDQAEDLAADSVENIISHLPSLKKPSAYNAWMWAITRNRLRSWFRSQKSANVRELASPEPATPDEIVVIREEHEQVVRALATLDLKDRELLWLREVLELDYRSIALRIESSSGAVRIACYRARQKLSDAYRIEEGPDQ